MKKWRTGLVMAAVLAVSLAAGRQNDEAEVLLKATMHKELVDGDLEAAIEQYKEVVARSGGNRAVAAKALVQMGQCYEKLGKEEARKAYEQVLREYADQREMAQEARTRLAALVKPAISTGRPTMTAQRVWASPRRSHFGGTLSRDGRYFSFVDASYNPAVRDLRTGENRRLTEARDGYASYSTISPDGQQVAYVWWQHSSEVPELRIVGLDGSKPRVLLSDEEVPWLQPYDWSPDGRQILAIFERKDATNQIVLVSAPDGSVRVLKSLQWRYPQKMSFSPDGSYIAYDVRTRQDARERDIFVLSTDGSRESSVVEHPANDLFAAWSPDGKRILFVSDRTGTLDYWAIQVAGGKPQGSPGLVKQEVGRQRPIGFTRTGAFYYSLSTRMQDVYIATLDPKTGEVLGPPTLASQRFRAANTLPEWSPDGRYLAYLSRRSPLGSGMGSRVIIVRSLETGEERELAPDLLFLSDTRLRWSPDGRSLLVGGCQGCTAAAPSRGNGARRGLYLIDTQTGDVAPIVVSRTRWGRWHAAWSLDGKAIFYVRDEDGTSCEIRVRDLETGRETQLYRPPSDTHLSNLALSPDGHWLAFGSVQASASDWAHYVAQVLLVMPAAGGEPHELLSLEHSPEPTPRQTGLRGNQTYSFEWTRDGSQLLFSRRVAAPSIPSELWRISAQGGEPQRLGLAMWGRGGVRAHPDGRRIAFTNVKGKSELWVMENFLPELESAK